MAGFVFPFFGYNDEKYGRMRRQDLLDLVLLRSRQNDDLKEELARLTAELEERKIIDAGAETIADAAMRRGKIYQLAHEIADSYVDSVRLKTEYHTLHYEEEKQAHYQQLTNVEDEMNARLMKLETDMNEDLMNKESESNNRIHQMEQESEHRIAAMEAEVNERMARQEMEVKERLKQREREVHDYCDQMLLEARANSQKYWDDIQNQIKTYLASQNSTDTHREAKEESQIEDKMEETIEDKMEDKNEVFSANPVNDESSAAEEAIIPVTAESASIDQSDSKVNCGSIRTPIIEVEQSDLEELENLIVISN